MVIVNEYCNGNNDIGFVWIPKTGGTDLTGYFTEYCKNIIIPPDRHKNTGKDYTIPCFTILREPIQRFISAFKFLNYITDITNINDFSKDPEYNTKIDYKNINDFLNNISDEDLIEKMFFKEQYTWLNNKSMYIVKYDSVDTYTNIMMMCKNEFKIDIKYDISDENIKNHKRINVSYEEGLQCELSQYNIERLKFIYKKDFDYYSIFYLNNIIYYKLEDFTI